jgi:hypothetical protein
MRRRAFLVGLLASAPALAHTPYGQWVTYRRKHLLIGCHKDDPQTYVLAKAMATAFEHLLPDAKARVARAPGMDRIASLMGTEQMDVAILDPEDAAAMAAGTGKFRAYGEVPVGVLALLQESKILVARRDFRADHGWMVAAAAAESGLAATDAAPPSLPWHRGAGIFRRGEPIPDPPTEG